MDLQIALPHHTRVEEFLRKHRTGLVTLVFTDIVGSTRLKQRLGDREGVALIQLHHALVREILGEFKEAQEISTAGDSFFLVFVKPSDAVRFALLLQAKLRSLTLSHSSWRSAESHSALIEDPGFPLPRGAAIRDRIGIHIGEVVIEEREGMPKPKDLYGTQVDIAARVMSLAGADQILLTRSAFDNARQVLKGEELQGLSELKWLNHGPYVVRGLEEPLEICEVGEAALAELKAPADVEKAQRKVSADEEPVLGWRPALGQLVPNTQWVLERKLGEGGFGEVWLGRHQKLKERRVFKFCFRADRVRSLKREMTLFRVLKERVGDHPNIVRLLEVNFEEPPFYVVMDHVEGSDLKAWCEEKGVAGKVTLETKLEIVAQIADALQAAHDAGVIHRDVKPGNILISCGVSPSGGSAHELHARSGLGRTGLDEAGTPSELSTHWPARLRAQAKLTDFGIGQVVSEEALKGMTKAGFTETLVASSSSSQTGSQLYMAPELLAGKPASIRSDIYSLGVVLYQFVVGDFSKPVTTDWAPDIADGLLRDDLQHCFAGDPTARFAGAGQLANNLRTLPQRQKALAEQQAEIAVRERVAYRRGVVRTVTLTGMVAMLFAILALFSFNQSQVAKRETRRAEKAADDLRLNLYCADMKLAQVSLEENNLGRAVALVRKWLPKSGKLDPRGFEWRYLWQHSHGDEHYTLRAHEGMVTCAVFSPQGRWIATAGFDRTVKIWDPTARHVITNLTGFTTPIARNAVAFSPEGKFLAVRDGKSISVFTTSDWQRISEFECFSSSSGISGSSTPIVFSPDGQTLAAVSERKIKFWQTSNWVPSAKSLNEHFYDSVERLAYSADGRVLAVGAVNSIELWDTHVWTKLTTPSIQISRVSDLTFSHKGTFLAAGTWTGDVTVWDLSTHTRVAGFKTEHTFVLGLAFSPDDKSLAATGVDQSFSLWTVAGGERLAAFKGHQMECWAVEFSPDGQTLLTGSKDGTAKVWNRQQSMKEQDLSEVGVPLGFSADSKILITVNSNGAFCYWNIATLKKVLTVSLPVDAKLNSPSIYALAPDSDSIAFNVGSDVVQIWSLNSRRLLRTLTNQVHWPRSLVFSPDGRQLAVTGMFTPFESSRRVSVIELASGSEHVLPDSDVLKIPAFSPGGQMLAYATSNYWVRLLDIGTKQPSLTLKGHTWYLSGIAFSVDGKLLASTSWNRDTRLWDLTSGKLKAVLSGHKTGAGGLTFSPDGKTLATASVGGEVKLWNPFTGSEVLTLHGSTDDDMRALRFSPDGNTFVLTGIEHNVVRVTTVRSLKEIDAIESVQHAQD
ncbi:MAG: hypothetical protein EXS36_18805 [Pedosphaera sp.]|nr:hypothetical protein [Pedosphaera sp.]